MGVKKKINSLIVVLVLSVVFSLNVMIQSKASDIIVDGSYLTTQDESIGTTADGMLTRGTHLMDGESLISKSGKGKIYCYGATTANHTVDYIAVIVYVDKYNQEDKVWNQIDAWVVEDEDTYYIATGKQLTVDRGYYYRVHCVHYAGNEADYPYDQTYSFTDGIWIA